MKPSCAFGLLGLGRPGRPADWTGRGVGGGWTNLISDMPAERLSPLDGRSLLSRGAIAQGEVHRGTLEGCSKLLAEGRPCHDPETHLADSISTTIHHRRPTTEAESGRWSVADSPLAGQPGGTRAKLLSMRRAASCGCRHGSNFIDESLILMTASLAARPSPSPVDRRPSRRRCTQARAMTLTIARALSPKQPKAFDPLGRRQGKEGTLNRQSHRSLAEPASQVNGSRTRARNCGQPDLRTAGKPQPPPGLRQATRGIVPADVASAAAVCSGVRRGRPPSAPPETRATTLTVARDSLTPKALSARRPGGLWTLKIPTDCSADPRRPDLTKTPGWARTSNLARESIHQLDPPTEWSAKHPSPRGTGHLIGGPADQPRRTTLGVRRGLSASG